MNILGISGLHNSVAFKKDQLPNLTAREYRIAQGFDSAAALVNESGVVAAAAEERFTREKATGAYPKNAMEHCLRVGKIKPDQVDFIAHGFSYEPVKHLFLESEQTSHQYNDVYSADVQRRWNQKFFPTAGWDEKFVPVPHHLAHAASAFYLSGFDDALVLVSDGMGEMHSMTVAVGRGKDIKILQQITGSHSIGILYGVFTLHLGFFMGMDEYKVMGLAPYGDHRRYFNDIMDLVKLSPGGTYAIPCLARENVTWEDKETHRGVLRFLADRLGPARSPGQEITQHHKDIAAALQAVLQATQLHVLRHFKRQTGDRQLCMAGGVTLNCAVNGAISRSRLFRSVFVQPASGDDGSALGAALYVQRQRDPEFKKRRMTVPLWGPEYSDDEVAAVLHGREGIQTVNYDSFEQLSSDVAKRLNNGEIIAWFQGRMEYGPRALGSRSILADPRDPMMRNRINSLVKKREGFRPFAPAVVSESASEFFEIAESDVEAYANMLFICQVRPSYRDKFPAVTHVDHSARVQTVSELDNPRFWQLLHKFEALSGIPMLLNTSFNVKGQPIVCTPQEAVSTFLHANLDALVIGNDLVLPGTDESLDRARDESTRRITGHLI